MLSLRRVGKQFLGVRALQGVDLTLRAGEVHALMGQNGAGKSTLIKVITGVYRADSGEVMLDGQPIRPASPQQAQALGISTVYQEVNLCGNLSIAENIVAGRYPMRGWRIDTRRMHDDARALLARLNLDVDVTRPVGRMPVAVQQMVAIARAVSIRARVLILDEPTSSLDDDEVQRLFDVMRRLRGEGLAILFVTHFLDQVYAVCDRITVLRNGERVGEWPARELPLPALVAAMVGRELAASEPVARRAAGDGAPLLQAHGVGRRRVLQPTDLTIARGEVVGLGGLLGSGRTELARLLFGLERPDSGRIDIDGRAVAIQSPTQAIRAGLALCPEDRKAEGIVAELSVADNIALALQARMGLWRSLGRARRREIAEAYVQRLGIKTAGVHVPIGLLSGGNQQKAVLARWLAAEPRLLMLDEPTRGIDVAAKQEILEQIVGLAHADGMGVLFISSEMEEVVRVADRIAVLRDRRKVGELPGGSGEPAVYAMIAGT